MGGKPKRESMKQRPRINYSASLQWEAITKNFILLLNDVRLLELLTEVNDVNGVHHIQAGAPTSLVDITRIFNWIASIPHSLTHTHSTMGAFFDDTFQRIAVIIEFISYIQCVWSVPCRPLMHPWARSGYLDTRSHTFNKRMNWVKFIIYKIWTTIMTLFGKLFSPIIFIYLFID